MRHLIVTMAFVATGCAANIGGKSYGPGGASEGKKGPKTVPEALGVDESEALKQMKAAGFTKLRPERQPGTRCATEREALDDT